MPDGDGEIVLRVTGGRRGAHVESLAAGARPECDGLVQGDPMSPFAFASRGLSVDAARKSGALVFEGDREALAEFHLFFDLSPVGSAFRAPT